jgi:hypothetical protein
LVYSLKAQKEDYEALLRQEKDKPLEIQIQDLISNMGKNVDALWNSIPEKFQIKMMRKHFVDWKIGKV